MIRNIFASVLISGSLLFVFGGVAQAEDIFNKTCSRVSNSSVCTDAKQSQTAKDNKLFGKNGIITKIVSVLSVVVGIAAVIVIIIAGIQYMLSTGDATKVNNAKNAILYAIVGVVVAALAQVIVVFVIKRLT